MPNNIITEDELRTEYAKLDLLRGRTHEHLLTDEQFKLIQYARSSTIPVSWSKLASYWESRGWGRIKFSTLKSRFMKDSARGSK